MNGSTEVYSSQQIKNWNGPLGDTNRLTAVWSANSYYYYSPSTTTPDTTTKGSPKTGMAWAGKKRH